MTWQTLDGKHLVSEHLKRLAAEFKARQAEVAVQTVKQPVDYVTKPLKVSKHLRPYIDKIAAEMGAAQKLDDEQWS